MKIIQPYQNHVLVKITHCYTHKITHKITDQRYTLYFSKKVGYFLTYSIVPVCLSTTISRFTFRVHKSQKAKLDNKLHERCLRIVYCTGSRNYEELFEIDGLFCYITETCALLLQKFLGLLSQVRLNYRQIFISALVHL